MRLFHLFKSLYSPGDGLYLAGDLNLDSLPPIGYYNSISFLKATFLGLEYVPGPINSGATTQIKIHFTYLLSVYQEVAVIP